MGSRAQLAPVVQGALFDAADGWYAVLPDVDLFRSLDLSLEVSTSDVVVDDDFDFEVYAVIVFREVPENADISKLVEQNGIGIGFGLLLFYALGEFHGLIRMRFAGTWRWRIGCGGAPLPRALWKYER